MISDFLSREDSRSHYDPGTEFHIAKIDMVANTGTYLDSPFHRYARGKDLAQLDLFNRERRRHRRACSSAPSATKCSTGIDVKDKAVLFHTGWDAALAHRNILERRAPVSH